MMDMPVETTSPIAITEKAARKIRALADKEGRADAILRVRVTAGGCSGFGYDLSFQDAPAPDDEWLWARSIQKNRLRSVPACSSGSVIAPARSLSPR